MDKHSWTHQSKDINAYDQPTWEQRPHDVYYKGNRAKEIWYGGRKIWNGNNTFWRFACLSMLGDYAYRSSEYYNNVYYPMALKSALPDYYASFHASFVPGAYLHSVVEETEFNYFEKYKDDGDYVYQKYPPFIRTASYDVVQTGVQLNNDGIPTLKFMATGVDNEPVVLVQQTAGAPFGFYNFVRIQNRFPCGVLKSDTIMLPPGTYYVIGNRWPQGIGQEAGRKLYPGAVAYDFGRINNMDFVMGSNTTSGIYDLYHSPDLSYNYISIVERRYSFTIDQTTPVVLQAEVCAFQNGESISWTPVVYRQSGPDLIVRRGQVRGRFNTKEDGSGWNFFYVVNDKRATYEHYGELSIDPTHYLDPDTLQYVEATCIYAGTRSYIFNTSVIVEFLDEYVRIYRSGEEGIRLYYIEGFAWYGGQFPDES